MGRNRRTFRRRTTAKLRSAERDLNRVTIQRARREHWFDQHPEVQQRLQHIERALDIDRTQQQLSRVSALESHDLGLEL